jgi:E3 ubiquitin-protein ligase SHPRH
MIECSTSRTAEMALRLAAVNRWCVTGTPIEKSLNDLRGLLLFLQLDPYGIPHWWKQCLYAPYLRGKKAPMEKVLSSVLWRTAKKDVLDQVNRRTTTN